MNENINTPTPEPAQPKSALEHIEALKARERELWAACGVTKEADREAARAWCEANDAVRKAERELEFETEVAKRMAAKGAAV